MSTAIIEYGTTIPLSESVQITEFDYIQETYTGWIEDQYALLLPNKSHFIEWGYHVFRSAHF